MHLIRKLLKKKFITGLSANAIAQAVTITIQIFSLPIFLRYLTLEEYGIWLMLSAIPVYFSLLDGGIAAVTMNKMTMYSAEGEYRKANGEFQSALLYITIIAISIELLAIALLSALDTLDIFSYSAPVLFLISATLLCLYNSLFDGIYRSTEQYAFGTNLLTLGRLVEWTGLIAGLLISKNITGAAAGLLIGRIISFISIAAYSSKTQKKYKWGFAERNKNNRNELIKLSVSYSGLVIGNAINLQGMVIMIGIFLGPSTTAIYSAYRTVTRIANQLIGAIGHTLWPSFTQQFVQANGREIEKTLTKWTAWCFSLALASSLTILLFSEEIISAWTKGEIKIQYEIFTLMLFASLTSSSLIPLYTFTVATNNFRKLPVINIACYLALLLSIPVFYSGGLAVIAKLALITEAILAAILLLHVKKILTSKKQAINENKS